MKLRTAFAGATLFGLGALAAPVFAANSRPAARSNSSQLAQTAKPTPDSPSNAGTADYSNQAAVIEHLVTTIAFHDDGTSTTTRTGRIKVQSQAGVQAYGMMQFPYASATTTMHVVYMRVIKPDKTVVTTPAENVLDMPAQITQQAPFYSDLKVLQVAVKGLEAGDTLEFQWRADRTKPLDPGQFWDAFNFMHNAIVLHEGLRISVPSDRKVIVKSETVQPTITTEGADRVYTWESKNLKLASDTKAVSDDSKPFDVQVTSFENWEELGKWFDGLAAPRAVPTPKIKAKADELTLGDTSETQKIQHLYTFVSTHFRYIGIGLGIGRYQPHAAEDVLSNDYGDCKDKHTLFEALLAAEGIKAYPALVNATARVDKNVPSPLQFDHVITAIPQDKGYLFLDTTPEVGPFGYLTAGVRDKWVLVIPENGAPQLVKTAADPPYPMYFHVHVNAVLDDQGRVHSKMRLTFRDDSELIFRLAYRQAGPPQWKEVTQKLSQNLGYGGTVSNVTVTPPDNTQTPFQLNYDYKRDTYGDWANRRIVAPFPPIYIPAVPDDAAAKAKPIKLGTPEEMDYVASVALPADLTPKLPDGVHLSTPFGDYDATYTYAFATTGGVLHVERKLVTKVREIKPADMKAYGKFEKSIENDEQGFISLNGMESNNDTSGSPEAQKLYQEGYEAWQARDFPGAMDYFQQAVQQEPRYVQAWTALGTLHAAMGPREQGVEELKKAIAIDPQEPAAYTALATLLMSQQRFDEALQVWRNLEKAAPNNVTAPERIGAILLGLKRYSEAVPELEASVSRNPENAVLLMQLGTAYANSGAGAKAMSAFENSLRADGSANNLNSIAYAMADANLNVSEALQDAQKAVTEEETETAKISIDHADPQDYATATRLAAYWDTLGWAYFRTGDLDKAEKYLNAGWHLSQDPTIADHLGQLYEKEGKKAAARQTYEAAVATGHAPQHALDRLNEIGGGGGVDVMPQAIQNLRIVQVPISPKPKLHVSADFVVLLSPDKVEARYVSGSGLLQAAEKALDATKFAFPFPDSGPVKTLRRGILDCEPELRRCSFAMYPLAYPQQLTPTRTRPENIRGATVLKLKTRHPPVVVKHSGDAGHNSGGSPQ